MTDNSYWNRIKSYRIFNNWHKHVLQTNCINFNKLIISYEAWSSIQVKVGFIQFSKKMYEITNGIETHIVLINITCNILCNISHLLSHFLNGIGEFKKKPLFCTLFLGFSLLFLYVFIKNIYVYCLKSNLNINTKLLVTCYYVNQILNWKPYI